MFNNLSILIIILTTFLNMSCEYTLLKKSSKNQFKKTPLSKAEINRLSYNKIKLLILDPYCIKCHREGKVKLNSFSEVLTHLDGIRSSVFIKETMPKNRFFPDNLKNLLLAWIENGAPEIAKDSSLGGPDPDLPVLEPLKPTFPSIRDRIFIAQCGDCHDPLSKNCQSILNKNSPFNFRMNTDLDDADRGFNKTSCEIELADYNELLYGTEETNKELVIRGDADASWLVYSIERTDGKHQMPPPEQGYSPLTDEEKRAIREWINNGALESE